MSAFKGIKADKVRLLNTATGNATCGKGLS